MAIATSWKSLCVCLIDHSEVLFRVGGFGRVDSHGVDRSATLNMFHQTRREFNELLWAEYVDLKAAFDSVDCSAL